MVFSMGKRVEWHRVQGEIDLNIYIILFFFSILIKVVSLVWHIRKLIPLFSVISPLSKQSLLAYTTEGLPFGELYKFVTDLDINWQKIAKSLVANVTTDLVSDLTFFSLLNRLQNRSMCRSFSVMLLIYIYDITFMGVPWFN